MGPHLLDPVFSALKLEHPTTISAETAPVNSETAPLWSVVSYAFPARGKLPPLSLRWYDGGKQPPSAITGVRQLPPNGAMLIGEHARLFIPELGRQPFLLSNQQGERITAPPSSLPPAPDHYGQWLAACKTGSETGSNFQYASRLTETCLLGNVAIRAGQSIQWNAEQMKITNVDAANQFLTREYRRGWESR
jgi:hypothetical protein